MSRPLPAAVYRRRRLAVAVVVALLGVVVVLAVQGAGDGGDSSARPRGGATTTTGDAATAAARRVPTTTPTADTSGTTIIRGTGRTEVAAGGTDQVGTGRLIRYRVETEVGTGIEPGTFAVEVDRILADRRGWTTADGVAFQRVAEGPVDVTVVLATPDTVDLLCYPLTTDGAVSCGKDGRAVINLTRWQEGAAPSKLDRATYRQYLITHEVGHLLGHHHEVCAGPGARATTMMQQTLDIGACTPNPWPAPDA